MKEFCNVKIRIVTQNRLRFENGQEMHMCISLQPSYALTFEKTSETL